MSVKDNVPMLSSKSRGGLAQVLQRGSAARGHRQQAAGFPHDSRRRIQPAGVTKAGKLYLPAVQQGGADQNPPRL
jgi:hypothetical protein